MCPVCVMDRPCICDSNAAVKKMREFYEANRAKYRFENFMRVREEPVERLSWGEKGDALMRGLWRIAKEQVLAAQAEQKRLRQCLTR